MSGSMVKIHEQIFTKKNSIFILKHAEEDEEIYFAYKYHELMQMGGYYISMKKPGDAELHDQYTAQIGVTPSEVVEDRAAKNFRSAIKEKMEVQEQKNNSKLVYLTSALLVVVVLAIGISTMNNYDKMNSVQSSIETLSKSVQGSGEEERQPEAGADAKAAGDPDSEEAAARGIAGRRKSFFGHTASYIYHTGRIKRGRLLYSTKGRYIGQDQPEIVRNNRRSGGNL